MDDRWKDSTDRRLETIEAKVDNLVALKNWVLGATSAIGVVVGAAAQWLFGGHKP